MFSLAEGILFIVGILLFVSIVFGKAGSRFGVPVLLMFLIVGMLFGSDGLGIQFYNEEIAQFVGMTAMSIILFSGGMDTKIREIRPVLWQGIALSTVGVIATTFLTGLFIFWITNSICDSLTFPLMVSFLAAAVMSSTDSASVFAILREKRLNLKHNLRPMLELESGSNDPMAFMLTVVLIQVISSSGMSASDIVIDFVMQFCVGLICGFVLGQLAVITLNKIKVSNISLYPLLLLAFIFFTYSFTVLLNGNGYLAVYLGGIIVGNAKIHSMRNITTFFDGFAWLFQIIMFLTLGLLVNPHELVDIIIPALLIALFMLFAARPAAVFLSLLPFRKMNLRSKFYLSWVGLRGAAPIIFATYPVIAGIEDSQKIFNIVFFITILSLVFQGTTVASAAKLLGLVDDKPSQEDEFGMTLHEHIDAQISEISVNENLLSHGHTLEKIPLPEQTLVVMIKRDGEYIVPNGQMEILKGDKLLLVAQQEQHTEQVYKMLGVNN